MSKKTYFTQAGKNVNYGLRYGANNSGYTSLAEELDKKFPLGPSWKQKVKSFLLNSPLAADYTEATIIQLFKLAKENKISDDEIKKIIYNFLNKNILPTPESLTKKIKLLTSNKDNNIETILFSPYLFSNIISLELLEVLMLLSIKANGKLKLNQIEDLIKAGISVDVNEILAKIGILLKAKISFKDMILNPSILKDGISIENLDLIVSQLLSNKSEITIERILQISLMMKESVTSNPVEGYFLMPKKFVMMRCFASSSLGYARQKCK